MTHLGILTCCTHHPVVAADPKRVAPTLRSRLAPEIGDIARLSVFALQDGVLPAGGTDCDAWIVSGPAMNWELQDAADFHRIGRILRAASVEGRPIWALWHGEHALHAALAPSGAPRPATPAFPLSIRNPIECFRRRDRLFRWSAVRQAVVEAISAAAPDLSAFPGRGGLEARVQ